MGGYIQPITAAADYWAKAKDYFPGLLLALRELVDNMLAPGTTRNAPAHGGPMCLTIDLEVVDTFVDEHHEADNLKKWTLKRLRVTGNGQHIPAHQVPSILNLGHGERTYRPYAPLCPRPAQQPQPQHQPHVAAPTGSAVVEGITGGIGQVPWQDVQVKEEQVTQEPLLQQPPAQLLEPLQQQGQVHGLEGPDGQENRDPGPGGAGQGAGGMPGVPALQQPPEAQLQQQEPQRQQQGGEDEVVEPVRGAAIYGLVGHGMLMAVGALAHHAFWLCNYTDPVTGHRTRWVALVGEAFQQRTESGWTIQQALLEIPTGVTCEADMPESENLCDLLALVTEEWREKLGGRKCDWHYTSPWHDFSALLADFDDMERLGETLRLDIYTFNHLEVVAAPVKQEDGGVADAGSHVAHMDIKDPEAPADQCLLSQQLLSWFMPFSPTFPLRHHIRAPPVNPLPHIFIQGHRLDLLGGWWPHTMTMALNYAHIAGHRGGALIDPGLGLEEAEARGAPTQQQQQQQIVPGTAPLDLHHLVSSSNEQGQQELRLVQQAEAAGLHVSPVLELQVSEGHTVKLMVLLKPCDLGEEPDGLLLYTDSDRAIWSKPSMPDTFGKGWGAYNTMLERSAAKNTGAYDKLLQVLGLSEKEAKELGLPSRTGFNGCSGPDKLVCRWLGFRHMVVCAMLDRSMLVRHHLLTDAKNDLRELEATREIYRGILVRALQYTWAYSTTTRSALRKFRPRKGPHAHQPEQGVSGTAGQGAEAQGAAAGQAGAGSGAGQQSQLPQQRSRQSRELQQLLSSQGARRLADLEEDSDGDEEGEEEGGDGDQQAQQGRRCPGSRRAAAAAGEGGSGAGTSESARASGSAEQGNGLEQVGARTRRKRARASMAESDPEEMGDGEESEGDQDGGADEGQQQGKHKRRSAGQGGGAKSTQAGHKEQGRGSGRGPAPAASDGRDESQQTRLPDQQAQQQSPGKRKASSVSKPPPGPSASQQREEDKMEEAVKKNVRLAQGIKRAFEAVKHALTDEGREAAEGKLQQLLQQKAESDAKLQAQAAKRIRSR